MEWAGALVTMEMEKGEVVNATFISAFTSKISLQESQVAGRKTGARKMYLW